MREIPLSKPDVGPLERQYVAEVLASSQLAMGPFLRRFEAQMAEACGTRHAVAVSGGTAALHVAVLGLGLSPGDEVVTTPFSFVASSNAVLYAGATPRFVDIDPATYHLDLEAAARALGPATRGILAVDCFGLPMDWPALARLAERHELFLLDDACHALGARVGERAIGGWGTAAAFGFYPNKQITTGEGGCLTTDSDALAARCRSLRNQGRAEDGRMEHVRLGFNYRMSELQAALGCAQLERLPELLARRARVAAWYREALVPLQRDLVLPVEVEGTRRSWFVYVVRLADHFADEARDALVARLRAQGIGCAPYFPSIHLQPYYRRRFGFKPGDFPVCEAVSARTLALPFHGQLSREAVQQVVLALKRALPLLPFSTPSAYVQNL